MDSTTHAFHELFAQLGLPGDPTGIVLFLNEHRPLAGDVALPDAPFWTPSQADFLREALLQDADWAVQVDQLSKALRDT
jgi:hypothetical protein